MKKAVYHQIEEQVNSGMESRISQPQEIRDESQQYTNRNSIPKLYVGARAIRERSVIRPVQP
jgi:glutaredoxin-related protein